MPDKEKVLHGLRACTEWGLTDRECIARGCPYLVKLTNLLVDSTVPEPEAALRCLRRLHVDALNLIDPFPRILTLDELRALPVGAVVWEEYRQDDGECAHLTPTVKSRGDLLTNWHEQEIEIDDELLRHDEAGFQVRYWSAEPDKHQMEGADWDERQRGAGPDDGGRRGRAVGTLRGSAAAEVWAVQDHQAGAQPAYGL